MSSCFIGSNMACALKQSSLVFYVNGKKVEDFEVNPEWTLLTYLRTKLHLSGSKLGCGEGGCGACTVMISHVDKRTGKIKHLAINACLFPVCAAHGSAVTTVEGIGSVVKGLHPAQERIAKAHGSQCGFCTPGIVMSVYSLLRTTPRPSAYQLEVALQGNLCRCTGYRPIVEGYRSLLQGQERNGCCKGKNCCQNSTVDKDEGRYLFADCEFLPVDPTQEAIFPPALLLKDKNLINEEVVFVGPRTTWFKPANLESLLQLKHTHPDARIVVGNTEVGVEVKLKKRHYSVLIYPTLVDELTSITIEDEGLRIGSAVTLRDIELSFREQMEIQPTYRTRVFSEVVDMLHWFAGTQIRNAAALGGNIMTASPISDLIPLLMAAGSTVNAIDAEGEPRELLLDSTFFTRYRQTALHASEVLLDIMVPYTTENEFFKGYKQARRRDDDIAIVNAGMLVSFEPGTAKVVKLTLAFGGMAPTTVLAKGTMMKAKGRLWDEQLLEDAVHWLLDDLPLSPDAPGGMIAFRRTLVISFFFKFHVSVREWLSLRLPGEVSSPSEADQQALKLFSNHLPESAQFYQVIPEGQSKIDPVGRPVIHASALKQATGEAVYTDDEPWRKGELYLTLVTSSRAHARIISINAKEALSIEGVELFLSASDISPERNITGPVAHDEEIFASEKVYCVGQVVGAIVARDQATAQRAAELVNVVYEDIQPLVITIEEAIEHNSFFEESRRLLERGNLEDGWSKAELKIEGSVRIGGQEHFYLETQACVANPREEEMDILCSTQNPTELQMMASHALGVESNKITVHVKRMGGGFGGKETRFSILALPTVIAAQRLRKPVRCMLDRDEDMRMTGGRHPFMGTYKAGFTREGRIVAMDIQLYSNAGHSLDLSSAVLERGLFHVDNAYYVPNLRVTGVCCKTNLPSNTAFRGFGGPQGMFVCETIITHAAEKLGIEAAQIRELNLYSQGDETHYGQSLPLCPIKRCWAECSARSEYEQRRDAVNKFNTTSQWRTRGLAMVPTKFGISFTALFFNQAGALVLVYRDGSVLLSHGGTEMGQGLHTKMIAVAARTLCIPPERIHVAETATDKVPNSSATAASASSDLNGMAVLDACRQIRERLEPFIMEDPKGGWDKWVNSAYFARVSLAASGFYKTPDLNFDWKTGVGRPFNYFCYGVACSEVELDVLTGDHQVLGTWIVMDVGESLNPALDIGQVEGGFVQGQGLFTLEELLYSPKGHLWSVGPGAYKLPGFQDVPKQFHVSLLRGAPNPRAVFSSKAVGEPPLFLASSIFFALKDAVHAARMNHGIKAGFFRLDSPATAQRLRDACPDPLLGQRVKDRVTEETLQMKGKPWAIVV